MLFHIQWCCHMPNRMSLYHKNEEVIMPEISDIWLSIKKLSCFGMGQLSYGIKLIPSHCFIIFTCWSIPWPRRPCCVARLLFKEKELWYQIQQTPNYKSTKLLFVELREGVQIKHVFFGRFLPNVGGWGGWFPNKVQTPKKKTKSPRLFRPEFHLSSPKSYKKPWGGWVKNFILRLP